MMFAKRLKVLRAERDITQAEFAKIIGVAQQTVGSWEKGKSTPNYELLNKIADYFNVSADYLLGRESHNASLSTEQKTILKRFSALTKEGKSALLTVLDSLYKSHSAAAI